MQIFKGAHPYRQQGHNTANYFTAPGGVEGVNMEMLTQRSGKVDNDVTLLEQLLAKIEALELDNKALKVKLDRFEAIQASKPLAAGPAQTLLTRSFGHDAMDLDNYALSLTDRSFPKSLMRSPVRLPASHASPPKDRKGKGSLIRGRAGDLDLAIDDDGDKLIMYIPTSCFAALVEPDVDNCRKLGTFREESGAKIIISPCIQRAGSQSPLRKNTARVVITGTQEERNVAAMLIANYRVAYLPGQAYLSPQKGGQQNLNTFRSGSPADVPQGGKQEHWR